MLTNPGAGDEILDEICKLRENAQSIMDRFFAISSMAVGLRHILGTCEDRDAQPMVSAIGLCSAIEDLAQDEASRVEDVSDNLAKFLGRMRTPAPGS
jgi:hypothetical protein